MSDLIVLAYDPGGRNTGVVLRQREDLLGWALEQRQDDARMPRDGHYLRKCIAAGILLLRQAGLDPSGGGYVPVVEEVAFWPERDPAVRRDQRGLYGTAMVYGAVLTRWPDAIVVDSGRGVAALHPLSYPEPIRQRGKGKDRLKDVRAAWDHSHAGETLHLRLRRER